MREFHFPCVQTQRRIIQSESLRIPEFVFLHVSWIATDWKAKVRAMNANLIGPTSERPRFKQSSAIVVAMDHAKFRSRFQTALEVHYARSQFSGRRTDWGIATERIVGRLTLHEC